MTMIFVVDVLCLGMLRVGLGMDIVAGRMVVNIGFSLPMGLAAATAIQAMLVAFYVIIVPDFRMTVSFATASRRMVAVLGVATVRLGMPAMAGMVFAMPVFLVVTSVSVRFRVYFGRILQDVFRAFNVCLRLEMVALATGTMPWMHGRFRQLI